MGEVGTSTTWNGGRTIAAHEPGMVGGVSAVHLLAGTIVSGGWDATLRTWSRQNGSLQSTTHTSTWVYGVAPCPSSYSEDFLLVASTGGMYPNPVELLRVFNLKRGTCEVALVGHRRGVHGVRVRGDWAASGSKDSIRLWHMPSVMALVGTDAGSQETPQASAKLEQSVQDSDVRCVEVCADAAGAHGWLAFCPESSPSVQLYDAATGRLRQAWRTGNSSTVQCVQAIEAAPQAGDVSGTNVLLTGDSRRLCLWDLRLAGSDKAKEMHSIEDKHGVRAIRMCSSGSAAGVEVATGGSEGVVRVWDVRTWRCVDELQLETRNHTAVLPSVNCIDMDGHQLVFGTAGTELVMWDRKACVYEFNGNIASYLPNYEQEVSDEPMVGRDDSLEAMQAQIQKIDVDIRCLQLQRHQKMQNGLVQASDWNKEFTTSIQALREKKDSILNRLQRQSS